MHHVSTRLDPDRQLALAYVAAPDRERLAALWALDGALGQALASGRDRMIGRIKLAWWREALEALDRGAAPAEPVLAGLAAHVLPAGISGAELAGLEEGWAVLAAPDQLDRDAIEVHAARRGGLLFSLSARLLGWGEVPAGGEMWALADFARHSSDPTEAAIALAAGRERLSGFEQQWPKTLRPLGMLARLAARDVRSVSQTFEAQGSPARMWSMLRHRLTGR